MEQKNMMNGFYAISHQKINPHGKVKHGNEKMVSYQTPHGKVKHGNESPSANPNVNFLDFFNFRKIIEYFNIFEIQR